MKILLYTITLFFFATSVFPQYCIPIVDTMVGPSFDFGCSKVVFHTIERESLLEEGYVNTGLSSTLVIGETYEMAITVGNNPNSAIRVWIDWNKDGDFGDVNELIIDTTSIPENTTMYKNITVPLGLASLDSTRMRIAVTGNFTLPAGPDTCIQARGDIEDYWVNISDPFNMVVSEIITEQIPADFCVPAGKVNQIVIRVKVITDGNLSPLNVTNFTFDTNGSSAGAISDAKLWSTDNGDIFNTNQLFGMPISSPPPTTFNISGNYTLQSGINYFWLTYDISSLANGGDIVDAQCDSVTISSTTYIPSLIAPAGFLIIGEVLNSYVTKQANIWYFGNFSGIDFNCTPPSPIQGGQIANVPLPLFQEAAAAISDTFGNLLFYTDGENVYNKAHNKMPNGTGLTGNPSTTQCLIAPQPGNDSLYYVFSGSVSSTGEMVYTIVDMTLNKGLGDVIPNTKNTTLTSPSEEHFTAVYHCNQKDIWVILHNTNGDFYAYLLTDTGLSAAIISPLGFVAGVGQLMASPNGIRLAINSNNLSLFDFNPQTGEVCNPQFLNTGGLTGAYGCTFSSDGSKLYAGEGVFPIVTIFQYNINAGELTDIIASKQLVDTPKFSGSQMQIGPDERIYIAKFRSQYLAVIDNINSTNPTFIDDGLYLGGDTGSYGITNFIQSWFLNPNYQPRIILSMFKDSVLCLPDSTLFFNQSIYYSGCPKFYWDFGDPASGVANTSTLFEPKHLFSAPGVYSVRLILEEECQIDTFIKEILILSDSNYTIPGVSICNNDFTVLGNNLISVNGNTYAWSPATALSDSTIVNPVASPVNTTLYTLIISNSLCADTIQQQVTLYPQLNIQTSKDTVICSGNSVVLNASGGHTYLWQPTANLNNPNISNPISTPMDSIMYSVTLTDTVTGCKGTDSVLIAVITTPSIDIGKDTFICVGETILLTINNTLFTSVLWSIGDTITTISVTEPGSYGVIVYNNICSISDSILVDECPLIFIPNAFSSNSDGVNDVFRIRGTGIESILYIIYDRWGNRVFESIDINNGWNGKINGKEASEGVYVYRVIVEFNIGNSLEQKGNLTLVR